jgi:hypothetical protein
VVVACSHPSALIPYVPLNVYVLSTPELTPTDYDALRDAAAVGGCQVRIFTVGDIDLEELKRKLTCSNATKLD